jgi:hypothetical protein
MVKSLLELSSFHCSWSRPFLSRPRLSAPALPICTESTPLFQRVPTIRDFKAPTGRVR